MKEQLEALIAKEAEKSAKKHIRNLMGDCENCDLNESSFDSGFIAGANFLMPVLMKALEQRNTKTSNLLVDDRLIKTSKDHMDERLLNLLTPNQDQKENG